MIKIKSKDEIKKMARASEIVKDLLFKLEDIVKPGVTTLELDIFAEKFILDQGAIPGFKGLYGFPSTLCVSINDEVVHGIPGNRKLNDGDIIGIDVGSIFEGFYGDHAKTFPVGNIDSDKEKLIDFSLMGVGTNILGYGRKEVDASVRSAIRKGNLSTLNCAEEVLLAEK